MEDRKRIIRGRVDQLFRTYGPTLQNEQLKKDIVQLVIDLMRELPQVNLLDIPTQTP